MLDAAHGKAESAVIIVQRVDDSRIETQVAGIGIARSRRRRRPVVAIRADGRQGSRREVAVARRRARNNRWNENRKECFPAGWDVHPARRAGDRGGRTERIGAISP